MAGAQAGIDIGDVTVNNAADNPVPVSDATAATTLSAISTALDNDAFGRLRVAFPKTIFDSKYLMDNAPLYWDDAETNGGGTSSTWNTNQASVTTAVSANTAGTRVRQTFVRSQYQPGHSQLVLMTGVLGTPATGITRRMGLFDAKNGLYFESGPSNVAVCVRTYTSGSAVDTRVTQANWNVDKMDGTGVSGFNLDFSKTQIFYLEFQWLGVGICQFGFSLNGINYPVHQINNANTQTVVYMQTPSLPLRTEITNSGTGGAAGLTHICSAVMSEGGEADVGIMRTLVRDSGLATLNNASYYPLMAFRHISGHESTKAQIDFVSTLVGTVNVLYAWKLVLNPTITGTALSFTPLANSCVEYDISRTNASTVSGGTELVSGVASSASPQLAFPVAPNHLRLGAKIDGTRDILVLAVARLTGTTETFYGSLTWQEYV